MPSKKSPARNRKRTKENLEDEDQDRQQRDAPAKDAGSTPVGKGASSLKPLTTEQLQIDYKVGIIMALSFPAALLIFWKFTLPLTWFVIKTILGDRFLLQLYYFKQDLLTTFLSECPTWIAAEERAFIDNRLEETVRRIPGPKTPQEFEELINFGEPIIITDAMKAWDSFGTWDCDSFTKQYKDAEYFDWQGDRKYKLKNITSRPDFEGMQCAAGYIDPSWPYNKKHAKEWRKKMSPMPAFLPKNALADEMPMTGFIGMPGTGVSPHLDETCDTLMTAQFSGVKNWSLSWPVSEDGMLIWRKPVVFTLYPGDVMIWYTNMRHHTEVLHGCSLSFSFNIQTPVPKKYFTDQRRLISDLPDEERFRLYDETRTQDKYFLDKCHLVVKGDQVFIN